MTQVKHGSVTISSENLKHKAIKVQPKRKKRSIGLVTMLASSIVISQLSFDLSSASAVGVPSPPTITATLPDGAITSTRQISIAYSGEAGATFSCIAILGGIQTDLPNCPPSPLVFGDMGSGLAEGSYTLKIKQNIGGQESSFAQTTWTVDFVAPDSPTITSSVLRTSTANSTAVFTFSGETLSGTSNQGFECRMDSGVTSAGYGAWEACQSPKSYSGLSPERHVFRVRQTDLAGNVSADARKAWIIDLTAGPEPTLDSAPTDGTSRNASIAFTGTGTAGNTFECQLDDGEFESNCTSPKSYSSLNDGVHTFVVRERDVDGNVSRHAETSWTIDSTSPTVAQQGAPRTPNSQLSLVYTVRFSETISGIGTNDFVVAGGVCQVSSVTLSGTTYQVLLSNCTDKQSVNLELLANSVVDAYGNQGPATNVVFPTISIDTGYVESIYQAPYTGTITSIPDSTSKSTAITGRTSQKNLINRTAERFPLATETQLVQIDKLETSTAKTVKVIATSEQTTEVIQIEMNISPLSAPRQFVTLLTVPLEIEGVAKFVVYRTSIPLLNPYLIM